MKSCSMCFFLLIVTSTVLAQNLMEERIWKLSSRKKSIFLDSGVFHLNSGSEATSISGVRNAPTSKNEERVVIDFKSPSPPKVYGHISGKDMKLSVDFFDTAVSTAQTNLKNSKFVRSIDFINVDGKSVTMQMVLKSKATFDVFYLENPGRLVIDIR